MSLTHRVQDCTPWVFAPKTASSFLFGEIRGNGHLCMRFEIFEFSPCRNLTSEQCTCLRALFACVQCRMTTTLVHYKDDNTPFGIKHTLQNDPIKISHAEYTEHFKPHVTVKENKNVTAPTRQVAGLCVKISKHKDAKRRAVKIKPYGRTNIVKVKFQFVFGLPDVASFARDTRNGFWYKVLEIKGEWLLVDAAMVDNKHGKNPSVTEIPSNGAIAGVPAATVLPASTVAGSSKVVSTTNKEANAAAEENKKSNAAAEENKESNAAPKPLTDSQETAPPPPSRTLLFANLLYVLFPNPLYVLLPNLLYVLVEPSYTCY